MNQPIGIASQMAVTPKCGRKCVGQHDAQPQRNHRQHDGHARLFQPTVDGVKQEEQADADIEHALDAQIVRADIQNFGFRQDR